MYIPPEDRRMFIMHSTLEKNWHEAAGTPNHFIDLFAWFESGGLGHVGQWLKERDLSSFNPKAEVEKTAGWDAVAATWEEPDDGVAFAVEKLGFHDVLFGSELLNPQFDNYEEIANMLKSPRKIGHRMQKAGYALLKATGSERWTYRVNGKIFRSRMAFVRQKSQLFGAELNEAMEKRGREICAAMSGAAECQD